MECQVMNQLKAIEAQARKDCQKQTEYELQIVYGQHCLEAKRIQELHWTRCNDCQSGPKVDI